MANPQQLNWSYFRPEFTGKPEEDVEAHLLRTNDWMETHEFPDNAKVELVDQELDQHIKPQRYLKQVNQYQNLSKN